MGDYGILKGGEVYLRTQGLDSVEFMMAVGIAHVQNFVSVPFYLDTDHFHGIKFVMSTTDPNVYQLVYQQINQQWTGVPYDLPVEVIDNQSCVNLTPWISNFSADMVEGAYNFMDETFDSKLVSEVDLITQVIQVKNLPRGVQIGLNIKAGLNYSIAGYVNLYRLDPDPPEGRVADPRVGYFYEELPSDSRNLISGEPLSMIHRFDLRQAPWTFIVDQSMPLSYHLAVKEGILSWNLYFEHWGLGQPFRVIISGDPDYPKSIDVFDMSAWYVIGIEGWGMNGHFSGYASSQIDYRSGANLFGFVMLNLVKLASNPARYFYMDNLQETLQETLHASELDLSGILDQYIRRFITNVTAHETGHQLGLRHNFMGSLQADGLGSIMDYSDLFLDFNHLEQLDVTNTRRHYDLVAIKYGYLPLSHEVTGVKHPQLDVIASEMINEFGTDENNEEEINPLIGATENEPDVLHFIANVIPHYQRYRDNLLFLVKNEDITPFEYNNMFFYLYVFKYPELASMLLRFIGGRIYSQNRTHYQDLNNVTMVRAESLLLELMTALQYSPDEHDYIIYDFSDRPDRQEFNKVQRPSLYSMNTTDLFTFYNRVMTSCLRGMTKTCNLIRLRQNHVADFTPSDALFNFTFAYRVASSSSSSSSSTSTSIAVSVFDIKSVDGIFPEIGQLLTGHQQWQTRLLSPDAHRCLLQTQWISHLVSVYQHDDLLIKEDLRLILANLHKAIKEQILPYLDTIVDSRDPSLTQFWRHPHLKVKNHWEMLDRMLVVM